MTMMTMEQLGVFLTLMQNGEGLIGKAPIYIQEKLKAVQQVPNPFNLLDDKNRKVYTEWTEKWGDHM